MTRYSVADRRRQRGFQSPPDTPFFSDLNYDFEQFGVFGEATYRFNAHWALTGGLRYYDFSEDRTLTFAGCLPTRATPTSRARRARMASHRE
jgi:outer membrane receptor protein involved in Fe transport